jgi:hypothetical protein
MGESAPLQFWCKGFFDRTIRSAAKRPGKVEYIHRSPVKRQAGERGAPRSGPRDVLDRGASSDGEEGT